MKFICVLIVKRMMEVGKAVLQKNNFNDLNDVRYVIGTFHLSIECVFYFSECYFRDGGRTCTVIYGRNQVYISLIS